MAETFSTSVEGLDLRLWRDVPDASWLRKHGRTRVIIVDDQWPDRESFFPVRSRDERQSAAERYFHDWLNVEVQFFPMPSDYHFPQEASRPTGTFSDRWFEDNLRAVIPGPPIAAIVLDLFFGDEESSIDNASGVRFLRTIRRHLPDVPVLILSNVSESRRVLERLKVGDDARDEFVSSLQGYIPKSDPARPDESLFERLAHRLIYDGEVAEPGIAAFSAPMRRVAREMRQIVISDERITYENSADTYPMPVTIIGEWGSGKNYIAERLVRMSRRRANPLEIVTFTDFTADDVIKKLFGISHYTDAQEVIYVDTKTGAVIARVPRNHRREFPQHVRPMGGVGILQIADMGGDPQDVGRGAPRAKLGTVILDELGAAPTHMQRSLISIFNQGRFTPENVAYSIPTDRRLDVWFVVPCTPGAYQQIIGDIKSRLSRTWRIELPSLAERSEDLLPLAVARLGDTCSEHPIGRLFSVSAMDWLKERSGSIQVRELDAVMSVLRRGLRQGKQMIFNAGDVKAAFGRATGAVRGHSSEIAGESEQTATLAPSDVGGLAPTAPFLQDSHKVGAATCPPPVLGKYRVEREIGSGGMGRVYLAWQAGLDRPVALKVLNSSATSGDIARFQTEAKAAAHLDHPNIVRIYDVGEQDGWHFFSMRYVKGGNVDDLARNGPLPCRKAASLVAKVAEATHYAHEKGVIHRDLKPSNILLETSGEPVVTDFGLAKRVQDGSGLTLPGQVMGTPSYMAPEQAEGNNELIGIGTDVYALGATLYRLLCWRPPFASDAIARTIRQISEASVIPPTWFDSAIDTDVETICLQCLAKKPRDRYGSALELATDLQRYLNGEPIQARAVPRARFGVSDKGVHRNAGELEGRKAAAAQQILAYVDWAITQVEASTSGREFPIVGLYRFVTGDTLATNTCKTRFCELLLFHPRQTVKSLRESDRLVRLATAIKDRCKNGVPELIEEALRAAD